MRSELSILLPLLLAVRALSAAEPTDPAPPPPQRLPTQKEHQRVPQATEPSPADSEQNPVKLSDHLRQRLLADAAQRASATGTATGIAPKILSAESVQWPNGALGCPQPGVMYTQMIVQGYRVVVEAGGKNYDYRLSQRGDFQLCESRYGEIQPPPLRPKSSR